MTFMRNNLPKSYSQYDQLTVCSNKILGGGHIMSIGDVLPLIIGAGDKPQIWLQAASDGQSKNYISIVENSVSKHPAIDIIELSGVITVKLQGKAILSVKSTSEKSAVVELMDFRLIGFNIYGDSSSLKVGGSTFTGNTMSGGGVLIGLG